jgi:predicted GNAT family acetyltransferase
VGDAPVVYARWRLEDSGSGGEARVAVIDRMLVMPRHRQQGYANKCLEFLFQVRLNQ